MKKVYTTIVILLFLILAGGVVYLLKHPTVTNPTAVTTNKAANPPASNSNPATTTTSNPGKPGVLVDKKTDPKLGTYLTDNKGVALYVFGGDKSLESTCYDACTKTWIPYTFSGQVDTKGLTDSLNKLLNFIKRTDGTIQIAYGTKPLYYYKADTGPGVVTGQGGQWTLVLLNP